MARFQTGYCIIFSTSHVVSRDETKRSHVKVKNLTGVIGGIRGYSLQTDKERKKERKNKRFHFSRKNEYKSEMDLKLGENGGWDRMVRQVLVFPFRTPCLALSGISNLRSLFLFFLCHNQQWCVCWDYSSWDFPGLLVL